MFFVSVDECFFFINGVMFCGDNVVCVWCMSGLEGENLSGVMLVYIGYEVTVRASMFFDFVNDYEGDVFRVCLCDDKGYMYVWNMNSDYIW